MPCSRRNSTCFFFLEVSQACSSATKDYVCAFSGYSQQFRPWIICRLPIELSDPNHVATLWNLAIIHSITIWRAGGVCANSSLYSFPLQLCSLLGYALSDSGNYFSQAQKKLKEIKSCQPSQIKVALILRSLPEVFARCARFTSSLRSCHKKQSQTSWIPYSVASSRQIPHTTYLFGFHPVGGGSALCSSTPIFFSGWKPVYAWFYFLPLRH